jgi:hypothetical protein
VASVAVAVLALVGCTSNDLPGTNGDPAAAVDSSNPAVVADSSLTDPAQYATNGSLPEEPGFVQVDANTSTAEQLVAAFETNGIADAQRWATEVIDHRPYATDDASGGEFDELRAALAAAGLDQLSVDAVAASLSVTR